MFADGITRRVTTQRREKKKDARFYLSEINWSQGSTERAIQQFINYLTV